LYYNLDLEILLKKFNASKESLGKEKKEFSASQILEIKQFRTEDLKNDSDYAKAFRI